MYIYTASISSEAENAHSCFSPIFEIALSHVQEIDVLAIRISDVLHERGANLGVGFVGFMRLCKTVTISPDQV